MFNSSFTWKILYVQAKSWAWSELLSKQNIFLATTIFSFFGWQNYGSFLEKAMLCAEINVMLLLWFRKGIAALPEKVIHKNAPKNIIFLYLFCKRHYRFRRFRRHEFINSIIMTISISFFYKLDFLCKRCFFKKWK